MMTCQQLTTTIASGELGEAGWRQRLSIRFHLLMCRHCRCYQRQIAALGDTVRSYSRKAPPPCRELEKGLLQQCQECQPEEKEPDEPRNR